MSNLYGNEIYHHGVKGQQWGKRQWQNEDGSYTPEGQAENNGHGRYSDYEGNKKINKENNIESKVDKKFHLTDKQKKILLGIGVTVGVGVTAYGAYKLYGALNDDGSIRMLSKPESWEDSIKYANRGNLSSYMPGHNHKTHISVGLLQGADSNCSIDAVIVDYRQRGYDVTAGLYDGGFNLNNINQLFYKGKGKVIGSLKITDAQKKLNTMPIGARGILSFKYKNDNLRHSVSWIMTENGIKIGDGENNSIYGNTVTDLRKAYMYIGGNTVKDSMISTGKYVSIMRTDNLPINKNVFNKNYHKSSQAVNLIAKGFMKEANLKSLEAYKEIKEATKNLLKESNQKSFVNTTNNIKFFADNIKISDGKRIVKDIAEWIPEKTYYAQEAGKNFIENLIKRSK